LPGVVLPGFIEKVIHMPPFPLEGNPQGSTPAENENRCESVIKN